MKHHLARPGILTSLLALGLALTTGVALADNPTPGGGDTFGQHIATMAPEHPQAHGPMFGECVSTMAQGGTCPHHPGG
jgi:hypothetical protein